MKQMRLTITQNRKPQKHIYWMKLRIVCKCGNVIKMRCPVIKAEFSVTCAVCRENYTMVLPVD